MNASFQIDHQKLIGFDLRTWEPPNGCQTVDDSLWSSLLPSDTKYLLETGMEPTNLNGLVSSLNKLVALSAKDKVVIAVTVDSASELLEGLVINRDFEDQFRQEVAAGKWVLLGLDVADQFMLSAICNAYPFDDDKISNQWAELGIEPTSQLFTSFELAERFVELATDKVPDHAPWDIYRVWLRK